MLIMNKKDTNLSWEIKTIKKNMEILEHKHKISGIFKKPLDELNSRLKMKKKVNELEDKSNNYWRTKKINWKKMNALLRDVWDNINKSNIYVNGIQEER